MGRHRADDRRRGGLGRASLLGIVAGLLTIGTTAVAVGRQGPTPAMLTTLAARPGSRAAPGAPARPTAGTATPITRAGTGTGVVRARPAATRTAGSYQVVGLGDSVPAGRACGCTTFVSLAAQRLAARRGLAPTVHNLAVSGQGSDDVLEELRSDDVRAELATADLVIIMIGANDFDRTVLVSPQCQPVEELGCYQQALAEQRVNLTSLLAQVTALASPHGGRVVTAGYWNVFLDGDVGRQQGADYLEASDALTQADNTLIAQVSRAEGATYANVYTPFKGDDGASDDTALLTPDGDHPNAAGHDVIARAIVDAVT